MKLTPKIKALLIVVAAVSLIVGSIAVASAVYSMTAPTSDPLTINPTPTPSPSPSPTPIPQAVMSKVTLTVYTAYVGTQVTLSTTVSDLTSGIVVNFFNQNNAAVGSATTDATGLAEVTITPPIGTWTYYATATHP